MPIFCISLYVYKNYCYVSRISFAHDVNCIAIRQAYFDFEVWCIYILHMIYSIQLNKWLNDNMYFLRIFLIDAKSRHDNHLVSVTYKFGWLLFALEDQN